MKPDKRHYSHEEARRKLTLAAERRATNGRFTLTVRRLKPAKAS